MIFFLTPLSSKIDQGTAELLVSVLNKRLCNSCEDAKMDLRKWPQLVARSEHLLTSRYSADLFHMLQWSCIFSLWSVWRCLEL